MINRSRRPHHSQQPLCLDLSGSPDPQLDVWLQFRDAALTLLDLDDRHVVDFPTFHLTRHVLELGLKRILTSCSVALPTDRPHSLDRLLALVPAGHPIHTDQTGHLRRLIGEYHRADPRSDASRYHLTTSGRPSFDGLCCTERVDAREAIEQMGQLLDDL